MKFCQVPLVLNLQASLMRFACCARCLSPLRPATGPVQSKRTQREEGCLPAVHLLVLHNLSEGGAEGGCIGGK